MACINYSSISAILSPIVFINYIACAFDSENIDLVCNIGQLGNI